MPAAGKARDAVFGGFGGGFSSDHQILRPGEGEEKSHVRILRRRSTALRFTPCYRSPLRQV